MIAIHAQGPRTRIEDLYETMHDSIFRFVRARVPNEADAEDITSQTFLQAFRWHDASRSESESRSWLFQIARNVMGDHWRRHYRHGHLVPLTESMVETHDKDQDGEPPTTPAEKQVGVLLSTLPGRYRRVLELRFLEGASLQETASELDITVANAKVLQHRALRKAATFELESSVPIAA